MLDVQFSPLVVHSFTRHLCCMLLPSPSSLPPYFNSTRDSRRAASLGWFFPLLPRPTLVVEMEGARPCRWWEALEPQGCLVGGAADDLAPQQERLVGQGQRVRSPQALHSHRLPFPQADVLDLPVEWTEQSRTVRLFPTDWAPLPLGSCRP